MPSGFVIALVLVGVVGAFIRQRGGTGGGGVRKASGRRTTSWFCFIFALPALGFAVAGFVSSEPVFGGIFAALALFLIGAGVAFRREAVQLDRTTRERSPQRSGSAPDAYAQQIAQHAQSLKRNNEG